MWRVGTVIALHDETATARTITLEVSDWPGHVAGQHVDVRLTASDGYSAVRSYSIASAPNSERRIELTVERLPDGEVSPYLTQEVAIGDPLEVRGPIGGWFVWHAQQTEPIQLVAGGSGHCSAHGYDSLACIGGQYRVVSIVVFRAQTGSSFVPRGTPGAIRSGPFSGPYLRIHTNCSEGLAAPGRPHRRRSDRERHLALKACLDLLRLRPHIVRRKYCWPPNSHRKQP